MLKVAFIGDSYSAYDQAGQQENSWTYLLSEHFPQHQYYNYAYGGRGYDYYQLCVLDAKIRNIDVITINRTFNHRSSQLISDQKHNFNLEKISDRYFNLSFDNIAWFSQHNDNTTFLTDNIEEALPDTVKSSINVSLSNKALSGNQQHYNDKWYENMDLLYNFKHIVKFDLLHDPNNNWNKGTLKLPSSYNQSATKRVREAFGIENKMQKFILDNKPSEPVASKQLDTLLFEADLSVSLEDDHWSPKANKWVFSNYILPQVVDILSE